MAKAAIARRKTPGVSKAKYEKLELTAKKKGQQLTAVKKSTNSVGTGLKLMGAAGAGLVLSSAIEAYGFADVEMLPFDTRYITSAVSLVAAIFMPKWRMPLVAFTIGQLAPPVADDISDWLYSVAQDGQAAAANG